MTLTLQELTNITEIAATIGVIITMIYVVIEVRETTRIYTANAHTDIGTAGAEFLASIYADKELVTVWVGGLNNPAELTEEQRSRFWLVLLAYWTLLANGYYMARVDPTITSRIEGMLDLMIVRAPVRQWWESGAYNSSPDFREYVDSRINYLKQSGQIIEAATAAG